MKTIRSLIPALPLLLLVSCYTMPEARPVQDDRVPGRYGIDIPGDQEWEITLYSDGYFYEYVDYVDSDEYNDFGTYAYDPYTRIVEFFYEGDSAEWNFSGVLDSDFRGLASGGDVLKRYAKYSEEPMTSRGDAAGLYEMEYIDPDGDRVVFLLTLLPDGRFKELTVYPESKEMWEDTGSWTVSLASGFARFAYDEWPEGNFSAIIDVRRGMVRAIEGDYVFISGTMSAEEYFPGLF